MVQLLLYSKLKILDIIKANIISNIKVPHPTLLLLAIGAVIAAVTVGIFSMLDNGLMGMEDAEAAKRRGKINNA